MDLSVSSPGWLHPGAIKPDFNTVDVRKTQQQRYANHDFVTSDLNPGVVFIGKDVEFNSMIKYFYTNRSLPKRKLTEAEMLEINSLYRIIGRCEADIARLQSPRSSEKGGLPPILAQAYERFGAIPRSTRALYCGSAVGLLVLVMLILRRWRNRDADY